MSDPRKNHRLWLGPLLAFAGLASYFTIIVRWQSLSDFPWLNLAVLVAALALSASGLQRAWAQGGVLRRCGGIAGLAVSTSCATALVYYCFFLSYPLPDVALALQTGQPVPQVTLQDDADRAVDLAAVGRGDVVLVFYRGFW